MANIIRHDSITLHPDASESDFQAFMTGDLMPYFAETYRGPTRVSYADLKSQMLLKGTGRHYVWATTWQGAASSLKGPTFEHTRMKKFEETDTKLKALEAFGKRATETVFEEVVKPE